MVVIVTGDRNWKCDELAERVVASLAARHGPGLVIRHGGCEGVDMAFHAACEASGVLADRMDADWSIGPRAGPARNTAMVAKGAGLCLAFHRWIQASRGTKDCACKAIQAGIPTWLTYAADVSPERLKREDKRLADWFRRYGDRG
jgi:hypothetical protein